MSSSVTAGSNHGAATNTPVKFKHGKKVYFVRRVDQDVKADYEEWLIAEAQASVLRLKSRGIVSAAEWRDAWNATLDHTTSGVHVFGGEICTQSLNTIKGFRALASLLFQIELDEMEELLQARREEVEALVLRLYKESFPNSRQAEEEEEEEEKTETPPPSVVVATSSGDEEAPSPTAEMMPRIPVG